ncbi:MAG: class I SAM-dependent methyltransferase, partial [Hyphomicrobiales bacterium]|nr:class I SAM-dependent methyltransferase [Hyphomicrobiales bacterium]
YPRRDMTLEEAQTAKMRHVAAKLKLEPGMHVAELGCGWGGLAIYMAKTCGVRVTAVNVSPEQLAVARRRAEAEGLADRVTFIEQDLRDLTGTYDRVVAIGALEHIGVPRYDEFFNQIKSLMKPDGFALIHAIGHMTPPGTTAPFIRKYIFPGGYSPALSEVFASTERTRLWVADCECLRLHYAWTIHEWHERFKAHRDTVVGMLDERFARMWEFYLAAVELGFENGSNFIFQLLLAPERDNVPIVRDYITDDERKLAELDG